jgi:hypothetical protein
LYNVFQMISGSTASYTAVAVSSICHQHLPIQP